MKIVYIDLDDTLCDFKGAFLRALEENTTIQYPQSQYRFFANLQPIEGAIQAVKDLIDSDEPCGAINSVTRTQDHYFLRLQIRKLFAHWHAHLKTGLNVYGYPGALSKGMTVFRATFRRTSTLSFLPI